ncbi:MAG: DUF2321 domain-containing protein [Negativicutes bacterium]|nr:DUF2321 domain-containing protein [Negativicutes bacterium]MDR3590644.1 DUF2321 domain-containing protein [Negativicutes bacterium]
MEVRSVFYKYDSAQICENGHIVNLVAEYQPERNQDYCLHCGASTITNCPSCSSPIQGARLLMRQTWISVRNKGTEIHVDPNNFAFPKFCIQCGIAFPWTKKKEQMLREYIVNVSDLSEEDKQLLLTNLGDLIKATPRADLAVGIWKSVLANKKNIATILWEVGKDYLPVALHSMTK